MQTYNDRGCPRDVLKLPPQGLQHALEVGEGDGAADVENDGILFPLDPLEVFELAVHVGVAHLAELVDLDSDAAVQQDDQRKSDADDQTHVDVDDDDGNEGPDPEEPVQLGAAGKLGEVVDLHKHALQSDHDDGGKNSLLKRKLGHLDLDYPGGSVSRDMIP